MNANCIVLVCLATFGAHLSLGQTAQNAPREPRAEDLIAAYEDFLRSFEKCTFAVHSKAESTGYNVGPLGFHNESSFRFWRHGDLWKELSRVSVRREDKGKLVMSKHAGERIYAKTGSMSIGYNKTGQSTDGVLATLGELSADQRKLVGLHECSPVVNGKMFGNPISLADVLRQSRLTAKKQLLGGREHWVVEGNGPWGYHAVWLDLEQGNLPRRIVQRKQGQDRGMDTTLAATPDGMGGPQKLFAQQLDVTGSSVVNGKRVVTAFALVMEIQWEQHEGALERTVFTIADWDLNPDFSKDPFVPTVVIPNGTRVTVRGQGHIDYEWRDGRIVKCINEASLANLGGNWLQRGSLITNGVVLLVLASAIGLGVYLWCRRRAVAQ